MRTLPPSMLPLLVPFAPLFSRRVWRRALVLLGGAILAPGRRTVAAALRVMGLEQEPRFERYHRVLNRAHWSSLAASRVLLGLLVAVLVPSGPLLVGIDETLERRRGAKIAAKGIYRDAVRSSHAHFVKASGLRWVCLMLLVPIAWAERVWALPFLTALAPSERYDRERGRRHKALTDWARQLLLVVRRWWPDRALIAVADSTYAASSSWPPVAAGPARSPWSPACASTPRCTRRPRRGSRAGLAARGGRASGSRRWRSWPPRRPRPGARSASPTGTARGHGSSRSSRAPRCGITAACRWCRYAGC